MSQTPSLHILEEALRNTERRRAAILEGSLDPIVTIDEQGKIIEFNISAEQTFGYSREDVLGKEMAQVLIPPSMREMHYRGFRRYLATGENTVIGKRLRLPAMRSDGSEFMAELSINVVQVNGRPLFTASLRDVTEQILAEEELKRLNAELESRVTERTKALTELNEELRRSNEELQRFASIASHDLQEPLRTISNVMGLLRRRYETQLDAAAMEFINTSIEASVRMGAVIKGLLDYSRIASDSLIPKSVQCGRALDEALTNLRAAIEESDATVHYDALPVVLADEVQVMQVFQNLLANAIKFRREGIPPEIHVSATRADDEWVISVADNGVGIETQYFDRIFGIFQRLHDRTVPGIGIGLAVCKRIIERHGGRMWVESEPNAGSTFHFSLPAA